MVTRRQFLKRAAVIGGGVVAGALAVKPIGRAGRWIGGRLNKVEFYCDRWHLKHEQAWLELDISQRKILLDIQEKGIVPTMVRIDWKIGELEIKEHGVIKILTAIKNNIGNSSRLTACAKAAERGDQKAAQIVNIVHWYEKLDEETQGHIRELIKYVTPEQAKSNILY